jgi:hypothetical protein
MSEWSEDMDMNLFLGVIMNTGLHPLPNIVDYCSEAWANEFFFSGI